MKTFVVFAFALCYFLVEGNHYPSFQLGAKEIKCLKKLGFVEGYPGQSKKPKIWRFCLAYQYFKTSILYLGRFNSHKVEDIFECVGWRNGALKKKQKRCVKKVLPGKSGLADTQQFIDDVKKKFIDAVDGDQRLYKNAYRCLETPHSDHDEHDEGFLRNTTLCMKKILPEQKFKKLDYAFHHFRLDLEYARHSFGDQLFRALVEIKVTTVSDVWKRISGNLGGQKLFNDYEKRTGERFLPGQFVYVEGLLKRLGEALNEAIDGANGKEKDIKKKVAKLGRCINLGDEVIALHNPPPVSHCYQ